MFIQQYQTCEKCKRNLPRTRKFFARVVDKEVGLESYHTCCRQCEDQKLLEENWKDGKLKCWICGEWLDPENFDKHSAYIYRGNRDKRCHKCKVEQNKTARSRYSAEEKLQKILQDRLTVAKERAKSKNIQFSITKEDLEYLWHKQNGLCAISGIPMTYEIDSGRVYTNVSVDKINPGKGYTLDNIQLVCMEVNQMKSDLDMQTLLFLCKSIINQQTENAK